MSNISFRAGSSSTAVLGWAFGTPRARDGARPDVRLQFAGSLQLGHRRVEVGQHAVHGEAGVDVVTEHLPDGRLVVGCEQVDAEVGGADGVGFVGDEAPARVEARRGAREGERDQQSEQRENRALHDAEPLAGALARQALHPQAPARFEKQDHSDEQRACEQVR
jgi:hypothetical protein